MVSFLAVVGIGFGAISAVSAQTVDCPPPAGVVCPGGKVYCGSACNDIPSPSGLPNQDTLSCSTCDWTCDSGYIDCGGTCQLPDNGTCATENRNVASACTGTCGTCQTGYTECGGTCTTNTPPTPCLSGTTWDPCTATCSSAVYIVASPTVQQTANIDISGTATIGGDVNLTSGKALIVDGTGETTLNAGNYNSSPSAGFSFNIDGRLNVAQHLLVNAIYGTTGNSTVDPLGSGTGDAQQIWLGDANDDIQIQGQLCFGDPATPDCAATWGEIVAAGGFWQAGVDLNEIYYSLANVGIGTNNPSVQFQINSGVDNSAVTPETITKGVLMISNDPPGAGIIGNKVMVKLLPDGAGGLADTVSWAGVFNANNQIDSVWYSQNTERMRLDYLGNLTVDASVKVGGNVRGERITSAFAIAANTASNDGPIIEMYSDNFTSKPTHRGSLFLIAGQGTDSGMGGDISMMDYNGSTWDTNMIIKKSGEVGIGHNDPATNLHILGTGSNPDLNNDNGILTIDSNITQTLEIGAYTTSPFGMWLQAKRQPGDGSSWPIILNPLGGNVGIGVADPISELTVNGNVSVTGDVYTSALFSVGATGSNDIWLGDSDDDIQIQGEICFGTDDSDCADSWASAVSAGGLWKNDGAGGPSEIYYNGGNVGIGTSDPQERLEIANISTDPLNNVARLRITETDFSQNAELQLQYGAGPSDHWAIYNEQGSDTLNIWSYNGGINSGNRLTITQSGVVVIGASAPTKAGVYKLWSEGNVGIVGDLNIWGNLSFPGADVAENFEPQGDLPDGTVVIMGDGSYRSVKSSISSYDKTVIGVVSDNAGVIMGRADNGEERVPIAMVGVVGVLISTENGAIEKGDLLTTSDTPGYAMKATAPEVGTVIGKALESFSGKRGNIKALINLQ